LQGSKKCLYSRVIYNAPSSHAVTVHSVDKHVNAAAHCSDKLLSFFIRLFRGDRRWAGIAVLIRLQYHSTISLRIRIISLTARARKLDGETLVERKAFQKHPIGGWLTSLETLLIEGALGCVVLGYRSSTLTIGYNET